MTSKLVLDNLAGRTTAGSIAVVADNGTTTNLQEGLSKGWIVQDFGTTIQDSFNFSSLLDNGTGDYDTFYTNNMANSNGMCILQGAYRYSNTTSNTTYCQGVAADAVGATTNTSVFVGSIKYGNNAGDAFDARGVMHSSMGELA